jgi:hypothetical protein
VVGPSGRLIGLALGALLLAGCPHRDPWPLGGDGDAADAAVISPPGDGGVVTDPPDARPAGSPVDAAVVVGPCDVPMRLGSLMLDGQAIAQGGPMSGADPDVIYYSAQLDSDPKPDILAVELYKGFGAFTTGNITTGTFSLTGPELDYATCGVCVRVLTNVDVGAGGDYSQMYFQTSGTVQLSSVNGNIVGTLSDVRLEHVTLNPTTFETTPVNDGCVTGTESAGFSAPIMFTP